MRRDDRFVFIILNYTFKLPLSNLLNVIWRILKVFGFNQTKYLLEKQSWSFLRFFKIIKYFGCSFPLNADLQWKTFQCKYLTKRNYKVFLEVMENTIFRITFFVIFWIRMTVTYFFHWKVFTLFFDYHVSLWMVKHLVIMAREWIWPNFRKKLWNSLFRETRLWFKKSFIFLVDMTFRSNERVKRVHNWI